MSSWKPSTQTCFGCGCRPDVPDEPGAPGEEEERLPLPSGCCGDETGFVNPRLHPGLEKEGLGKEGRAARAGREHPAP